MKKETVITTITGIIMGVIVAFVLISNIKEKKVERKKVIVPHVTPIVTIPAQAEKKLFLTVEAPENDLTTDQNTVNISGKADQHALIIVNSPFSEKIIKTTEQRFTLDFPLSFGQNVIKITSYVKNDMLEKILYVYYLEKEK